MKIKEHIEEIGKRMIENHPRYSDVIYDLENGYVPRCLIYEEESRSSSNKGSVMVGINPGNSSKQERNFYIKQNSTYEATLEYWKNNLTDHKYYKQGRSLINDFGRSGPILWTELVKCESRNGVNKLLVQTIRDSIHRFLFKELKVIPKDWPLIASGQRVFEILSYSFPERTVIGIPHITGSYGHFHKLKKDERAKSQIDELIKKGNPVATRYKCRNGNCKFDI